MEATVKESPFIDWQDIAGWLWVPIAGLSALVVMLARIIWDLLSRDWRRRQDKIDDEIEAIKKSIKELRKYVSDKEHEIINLINNKMMGESVVKNVSEQMDRIEKLLESKK